MCNKQYCCLCYVCRSDLHFGRFAICNHRHEADWDLDYEFVIRHFLGKRYVKKPDKHAQVTSVEDNASSSIQDNNTPESNVQGHSTGNNTQDFVPGEHVPLVNIESNIPDSNIQNNSVTELNVQEHRTGNNTNNNTNQDNSIQDDSPPDSIARDCTSNMDNSIQDSGTHDPIEFYKSQVLDRFRAPETKLSTKNIFR